MEKKRIEINKFNNFNSNNIQAQNFYNYYPKEKLKNSLGVRVAKFPYNYENLTEYELNIEASGIKDVQGVAYFRQYFADEGLTMHRLLLYGSNQKVYINQMLNGGQDLDWLYSLKFNTAPITLAFKQDDEDSIILASDDQMKIWKTNKSPYTIEDVPVITSMCMNEGVLFCTIKEPAFKIWYATDLDAENIGYISSNSGYISLEDDLGYARKILTFNEEVYVFRDYGISKINYVKKDMSVSQVYQSNTKIYANTVSVCGNSILFMTKEGLYYFNGVKVSKTSVEISTMLPTTNDNAYASSLASKYYLALNLDFGDENKILCEQGDCVNNALLVVDTQDFSYQIIRGVDIKSLLPVKTEVFEKMLCVFNSGYTHTLGEIVEQSICFENSLPKFWSSKNLVEDYESKTFTKLVVHADANITIKLKHDNEELCFKTYTSGLNEFLFKIYCKDLQLEITSNEESAIVNKISLDYYEN